MGVTGRAWLFAGQGSQRRGMGLDLIGRHPDLVRCAEDVLGYCLTELCSQDPQGRLGRTLYAQPALFVVTALQAVELREAEPEPDWLAGHSLGELTALFAAGSFDFETGVRLVHRRGELMDAAKGGGMLAVVDLGPDDLTGLLADAGADDVDLANINSSRQLVLSGPVGSLEVAAARIRRSGRGRCTPLRVSAAFHSRYMRQAAAAFEQELAGYVLRPPRLPVVANVTGRPYAAEQPVSALLARQIDSPVRWRQSMRWLVRHGVRQVTEVGPGTVLTGLWQAAVEDVSEDDSPAVPVRAPVAVPAPPPLPLAAPPGAPGERLGAAAFRSDYGVRMAYLAGSMFRGIASVDLVAEMARAGLMGFFGSGGLSLAEVELALVALRARAGPERFGMNLLHTPEEPARERALVELYLRHDVRFVEAAAYTQITAPLVLFRFRGAGSDGGGLPVAQRHVVAKVSRPDVAASFMRPPPDQVLESLSRQGALTPQEVAAARRLPVAGDVCAEADSGGHTDGGSALTLIPTIRRVRDEVVAAEGYPAGIRLGAAGGLGTPDGVAAAFLLGADFVVSGSVNQCTPQAGTSDVVKRMLAELDVHDTAYAPAGDMFELGAQVQVVKRGTMFAPRANKLLQLYRSVDRLEALDGRTVRTLEGAYFRRSLAQVWDETCHYYNASGRADDVARAEGLPKRRMAMVFKSYFAKSVEYALAGDVEERVNFQIHCGPAMGAFNRFCAGTPMQDWRSRDPGAIADALMTGAANLLKG